MSELPYRDCVGVVLCNADGQVFAGERVEMPGAWQMPQGGIDAREGPEAAALRELQEETSVPHQSVELVAQTADWLTYDFPADLNRKAFRGKYRGQRQKWFLYRLTGAETEIKLDTDHPEFASWTWMTADTLLGHIVAFKRPVYRAVFAAFATHLA